MYPTNFWPQTYYYWPLDYWADLPFVVIVTISGTVYGPSTSAIVYGGAATGQVEG